MKLASRKVRLRLPWLLALPYLAFAGPTPPLLALGGALAGVGVLLRAWAAGVIEKDAVLTTGGPYAHTRNPLYLGTFLIGLGLAVAGGRRLLFVPLFLAVFIPVYGAAMRAEARFLAERFGGRYRRYAGAVPFFFPRLRGYRPPEGAVGSFALRRYVRHGEYRTGVGVALVLLFLWFRLA